MRNKVAVQMRNPATYGKDSMSVLTFLTEFIRAGDSSHIFKVDTIWFFRKEMNAPTLAAFKERLILL